MPESAIDDHGLVRSPKPSLEDSQAERMKEADNDLHSVPDANQEHAKPSPAPRSIWARLATLLKDQWFLVGMAVVIVIASQVQVPDSHQRVKE